MTRDDANLRYVLDASVAVSWCFRDEQDARADVAIQLFHRGAMTIAPIHWWFEVRNVVMLGVRRRRVTEHDMIAFFLQLAETPVTLAELPGEEAVFALAQYHRLSLYDAAYLELAIREKCPLATLDQSLARAAAAEGVALIGA